MLRAELTAEMAKETALDLRAEAVGCRRAPALQRIPNRTLRVWMGLRFLRWGHTLVERQ